MKPNERHQRRSTAIRKTMDAVSKTMAQPHAVDVIDTAKEYLIELAKKSELFPYEDFPIPEKANETLYKIFSDEDGQNALYVYVTRSGGVYRPHDHGKAWAIIAGVHGHERHYFYERKDGDLTEGPAELVNKGSVVVGPGSAASCMTRGIHSIEHIDHQPFLHLHCYGYEFEQQDTRLEYDLDKGIAVYSNDVGKILDMPLSDE
ncbi:hypothetical protein [Curvivirga sp.]|uniref:hypothetical protein n=1 Tax=Curvivirga sp. TaxID=2856848 RepID=UPI003B59E9A0